MFNRLRWILVTYLTRPRVVLSIGLGVTLLLFTLCFPGPKQPPVAIYPAQPAWRHFINSKELLDEVRATGRQETVDAIDMYALWIDTVVRSQPGETPEAKAARKVQSQHGASVEFFEILREFPNLRGVTIGIGDDQQILDEVARVSSLEFLSVQGFTQPELHRLRSLTHLQRMEFQSISKPLVELDQLAILPQLQTLIFQSASTVTDSVLADAGKLPHLQTLALDFPPSLTRQGLQTNDVEWITAAGFDALAKSPTLKHLYVGRYLADGRPSLFSAAEPAFADLPPSRAVQIQYASAIRNWPPTTGLMQMAFLLLVASAIGEHLGTQFRGATSQLTPNYAASHIGVAAGLAVLLIALGAGNLILRGASPGASLALVTAQVSIALASATLTPALRSTETGPWRMLGGPRQWSLVSLFTMLAVAALPFSPSVGPALMMGALPGLSTALVCLSMVAWALTVWWLPNVHFWSTQDPPARIQGLFAPQWETSPTGRWGWNNLLVRREIAIEAIPLGVARLSQWARIQRWRLGNPSQPLFRLALVMLVAMVATFYFSGEALNQGMAYLIKNARIIPFFIMGMMTMQIARNWRLRRASLGWESTLPISRQAFQRELVLAFALDILPTIFIFAVLTSLALNLPDAGNLGAVQAQAPRIALDALMLFAGTAPLILGLAALFVVLLRVWVALLVVYLIGFATIMAVTMPIVVRAGSVSAGRSLLLTQLWIPALAGIGLSYFVLRLWRRMEFGAAQ